MNITIIGVPYDLDRPYTGMGNAPDALLDAGLARRLEALGYTTILAEISTSPSRMSRASGGLETCSCGLAMRSHDRGWPGSSR